jgi:TonB-dependent receptor
MKKIALFLLFIIFTQVSMAQKAFVKGKIVDDQNQPLPGANVSISETNQGTFSSLNGEFYLSGIEAGNYTLEISYIGFNKASKKVDLQSGATLLVNFELTPGLEIGEVVVNSRLVGEAKSINNQKNALNITNMISFEQLERFPDANIGDALKRLPGVNVQYDQGEARFGNVRGTSPELNSITINGERIPSAEAEVRVVQLDLVPSDMIQSVEFNKAVTPDMDADAIGGSINLTTKSAPYKKELKGDFSSGWNFVANKPSFKGSLTYSNRFAANKLGLVLSASGYDNFLGSDNIEALWNYSDDNNKDGSAFLEEFQVRQYYIERLRQSYSASVDYQINENHSIYLKSIYNWRNDWENRYRFEITDIEANGDGTYNSEVRRQLKFGVGDNKFARLEDQKMMNFSLGGDHSFGIIVVDWAASYSKANEERPNERYLKYRIKDVTINQDISTMETPSISFPANAADYINMTSAYEFDKLTEEYQYTEEVDQNFRLNFELPFSSSSLSNKLKFGARYKGKSKMRDNWLKEFSPVDEDVFNALALANLTDISKENFMPGDYLAGSFIKPEISDLIDLNDETQFEAEEDISENAGDFSASEAVIAAYLMYTHHFGEKFTVLAGVRAEQTMLEYQGRIFDIPSGDEEDLGAEPSIKNSDKIKDVYLNILPSLHIKFAPNSASNIRFAYTNTISRPNYYDLVPYEEINRDDEEIFFGNPELLPTTSTNLDLMYENFFKNIGSFSTGVFYKELKNIIAWEYKSDFEYNGFTYQDYRKPVNIADASLLGFEAAFSRRLDFLPSLLKNLSVYSNYTYIQSELKNIEFEGRDGETLAMPGTPKHNYNVSLAYDDKKLDFRISFNHSSAFVNVNDDGGFGEEAFFDYYYDKVNYLDFNINYKINKSFRVFFNANNMLNQPLRTYLGAPERTMQAEYYGVKLNFGVKFKI